MRSAYRLHGFGTGGPYAPPAARSRRRLPGTTGLRFALHGRQRWVSLLAFGLFIEVVQYFLPYRQFSLLDLAADGIGIWLYVAGVRLVISARVGRTRA